jgi:aminoglycoside phosphotransferase (APT) family kinase protein
MIDDRLQDWLSREIDGFRGPARLQPFEGGQSNPTFLLDAPSGRYVLRRRPMGNILPTAHAVDREFRVLSALGATSVPVPRVLALCTDEAVLGSAFYVMEWVEGRVFWDPRLPDLEPAERYGIFASMNDTIAAIHGIDPASVGLDDFGRHGGYIDRQIRRWTQQYQASTTDPNMAMEELIRWLPTHKPADRAVTLVHGDYRLDNLLIHPTDPKVAAVLDWELSTLGDPIADFAYHMITWRIAPDLFRGLAGVDFSGLGIPSEELYLARYLETTGQERPQCWDFYIVLSLFRIAAILQGIARRAQDGTASDRHAHAVGAKARPLSELAWSIARTI